jgi:putative FmdB family regulatory protein
LLENLVMPIYEYQCQDCGHEFEAMQKMSEARLVDCPVCGKPELKKMVSAAGFKLKGSGWYETDFKNSGKTGKQKQASKPVEKKATPKKASSKSGPGCGHSH